MSSIPAKISRPVLPQVLPRIRLFAGLDKAAARQIVWVSAPPGSGKTTLVASYLDTRKLPTLWYHVDEGDGDIGTLFYYLGLAVRNGSAQPGPPLPLFTPEYLQGISAFSLRFFEALFSRLKTPAALVFDDYNEAPADSVFHDVISKGLSVIPRDITVIIMSRNAPPEAMTRLRAANRMAVLGWPQLQLTFDESNGIISLNRGMNIPFEILRKIHERTQGWAAGVVLMTENIGCDNMEFQSPEQMQLEEIFQYFSGEILSKISAEMREFLLKTSFFPKMTSRMADGLTGLDQAGRILPFLVRNNYFTQMYAHQEPVYQYHPLFRNFLRARAREHYPPDTISQIQREAAHLLANSGEIEGAVELLRDAGDWEGMVSLVQREAEHLLAQGRGKTIHKWLTGVPGAFLESNPWLSYWLGVCMLPTDPCEGRGQFERAFHAFQEIGDAAGIFLSWSGVVDSFVYEWNDFTGLALWIERLEAILRLNPSFPSSEIEARTSAAMVCAIMWRQPHHPGARRWLERALSSSDAINDTGFRMQACFTAANYHLWMGNLAESTIAIDEIRRIAQTPFAPPLMVVTWKWLEAALANCTAAPQSESLRNVEEGLAVAAESGVHIWDHMLYAQAVFSALNHEDTSLGEEYLKKMEATLNSGRRHSYCHFHYLASWLGFLNGDVARALAHAEKAFVLAAETGFPLPELLCRLAVAQGAHETGEHRRAMEEVLLAGQIAEGAGSNFLRYMCLMTEACFLLDLGGEAAALPSLRAALALGRRQGYLTMFWWWRPQVMTRLCCKALEAGIEVDYVREMVRRRGLFPDAPPVQIENWPWPIRIYTLGRFGIIKDGEPLRFSGKVQQKPLALLKGLISFGGRNVAEERLIDLLWPEADGDASRQAFTTTLHRLRRLLNHDKAVQLLDGKVTLDACYCWIDMWAFERLTGAVETVMKCGMLPPQSASAMKKALDLYSGHFLSGDTALPSAISKRERLRSKAIRLVGMAGAYHEEHGEWRTAIEYYARGLDLDDHIEEFYQRLMLCHQREGRPGEALTAYERCRRVLATIGIRPSQRTRAIHEAVLDGKSPDSALLPTAI